MQEGVHMDKDKVSPKIVLKSGLWYTISNFEFRAVAFITINLSVL